MVAKFFNEEAQDRQCKMWQMDGPRFEVKLTYTELHNSFFLEFFKKVSLMKKVKNTILQSLKYELYVQQVLRDSQCKIIPCLLYVYFIYPTIFFPSFFPPPCSLPQSLLGAQGTSWTNQKKNRAPACPCSCLNGGCFLTPQFFFFF